MRFLGTILRGYVSNDGCWGVCITNECIHIDLVKWSRKLWKISVEYRLRLYYEDKRSEVGNWHYHEFGCCSKSRWMHFVSKVMPMGIKVDIVIKELVDRENMIISEEKWPDYGVIVD